MNFIYISFGTCSFLLTLDSNDSGEPPGVCGQDKETLQVDLAKALARVDVLTAGQAASSQVDEAQLRPLQTECEALKDEVTNKDRKPTVPFPQLAPCGMGEAWRDRPQKKNSTASSRCSKEQCFLERLIKDMFMQFMQQKA